MVRAATSCMVVLVALLMGAFPSMVFAEEINMCLQANGGVFEPWDYFRDGDWDTPVESVSGQSGNIGARIIFPESHITRAGFAGELVAWKYDGIAHADAVISLRLDGTWTMIDTFRASDWSRVGFKNFYDNNGQGWDKVSGIEIGAGIYGDDTGSAYAALNEMAAWAVPEPSTLVLLTAAALALTFGWWRRKRAA